MSEKSIDLTFLTSMTGNNKEKMTKYINMFLQHAPNLVSQLETNLQQADWPGLKTTAHTLKSQFSYMGATEAKELALQLETHAADQTNQDQYRGQIDRIKTLFNSACLELKAEIDKF